MPNRPTERRPDDHELMRFVHGELPDGEARQLAERLEHDGELRRRYEVLRDSWNALELPPAPALPDDFRQNVVEAARRIGTDDLSWTLAPRWARAGTALALLGGMVVGLGMGSRAMPASEDPATATPVVVSEADLDESFATGLDAGSISLAEAYWLGLEDGGESLLDEADDGERL